MTTCPLPVPAPVPAAPPPFTPAHTRTLAPSQAALPSALAASALFRCGPGQLRVGWGGKVLGVRLHVCARLSGRGWGRLHSCVVSLSVHYVPTVCQVWA